MKGLHKFIDTKIKPLVDKENKKGKKGILFWVYDSLETFLFTPGHTTKKGSHVRDGIDLKRTMMMVILALVPCLLFGIYNTGHQYYIGQGLYLDILDGFWDKVGAGLIRVLPFVAVSYGVGLGIEFIFCVKNQHGIHEGFLVSGMLIPLIMPAETPLWMVGVATAFAVVIGKEVFGGTGMNILNVALVARAFVFFAYPASIIGDEVWIPRHFDDDKVVMAYYEEASMETGVEGFVKNATVLNIDGEKVGEIKDYKLVDGVDAYTGATSLAHAALTSKMQKQINSNEEAIESNKELIAQMEGKSLSETDQGILDQIKGDVEEKTQEIEVLKEAQQISIGKVTSMEDSFIGFEPGSIGETSVVAILLGAILLILTGIGSWQIMFSMVIGGLAMGYLLNAADMNPFTNLDPIHQIVLGGFMFGVVFMATDPVTACQTTTGKYIYGFLAGSLAILIRVVNPAYPEGVMLAILFANVSAPLIDHMVVSGNIKRRRKRLKTA